MDDRAYRSSSVDTPFAAGRAGGTGNEASGWEEVARVAAEAGGELILALPDGGAASGLIVRFANDGDRIVFLSADGGGDFRVVEEEWIDAGLAQFARTSIDLLEHIRADRRICARVAQH